MRLNRSNPPATGSPSRTGPTSGRITPAGARALPSGNLLGRHLDVELPVPAGVGGHQRPAPPLRAGDGVGRLEVLRGQRSDRPCPVGVEIVDHRVRQAEQYLERWVVLVLEL